MNKEELSKLAQEFLDSYKEQNVETIKNALTYQQPRVVRELEEYFNVEGIDNLALAINQYKNEYNN